MIARRLLPIGAFCAALLLLLLAYLPTLQTIPNGSDHLFMIDVGETQVVLNVWGTLHATGYPHYVIAGNALVALLKVLGISAAAAPAVVSLIWGVLALGLIFLLALNISGRAWLAALLILAYGLTRFVWLHQVIAEIYSFGLFLLAALLWIALGLRGHDRARLFALALLGGMAVAHHRALALAIPALLFAMWPVLRAQGRKLPGVLIACLLLGLIGFIPYAYLPLRETAGSAWAYGEPDTLSGLLDQFLGREAERFIGAPETLAALGTNIARVTGAVIEDMTPFGVIAGVIGLIVGVWRNHTRHAAIAFALLVISAYIFHCLLYSDLLVALLLMISLPLAFGWLFAALAILYLVERNAPEHGKLLATIVIAALATLYSVAQIGLNREFIAELTGDHTGLDTIALFETAPENATVMIAWGPRYFAAGFAHDVESMRPDLTLADHKADYRAILEQGELVTPDYTFYNQPLTWWEDRIGAPVYLSSPAPGWVQIADQPEIAVVTNGEAAGISAQAEVQCMPTGLTLSVLWAAETTLTQDLSVFVHVLDADGNLIGQGDQSAPVYGLRPLTTWQAGEQIRDTYMVQLPVNTLAARVRYGLYNQNPDGSFTNLFENERPVNCAL
ncbi:MAG: DUF2723 domain-containing protein [Anaerolineae bacterium]|nr:DUF2723 domain-containing protein [Anaerolineae bacterium]